jgi:hypothetical protein
MLVYDDGPRRILSDAPHSQKHEKDRGDTEQKGTLVSLLFFVG